MGSWRMTMRLCIVAAVLLGGTVLLHAMSHGEPVVSRERLSNLPYTIGNWTGRQIPLTENPSDDARIVQALSVTDYTNREYVAGSSVSPVDLYIGYYASQRTGDTIHSPKNCLPGAGWEPTHVGDATITLLNGEKIVVNDYVIAQGLNKEQVFYWYQGRGRVIASEYWGKFWMIDDAITRNRTDGALVRVITPISGNDSAQAHARLVKFTQQLFPLLGRYIPN